MKMVCLIAWGLLGVNGWLPAKVIRVPGQQATIQQAIEKSDPGDIVLVSPGIYRERLRMKPGMTLRSVGEKGAFQTVIDCGGLEGELPGVTMAEGATLDGFTVTGVGRYDEARWKKNWDDHGNTQSHEHMGGFGIPGIGVDQVNCTVINNIVHHNGGTGIAISGSEEGANSPVVRGNISYRNMGGGIGSMNGSAAVIDSNRCYENFYAGIGNHNASPLVMGNTCYINVRAGIGVSEGACPVIRGNDCYQNRRAGIGVRTGVETRPVIEGNDCYENEMAGIGMEEGSSPIVRGNNCYRNLLAGIGCRGGAIGLIVGNSCYENKAAGIGIESAQARLVKNKIERNQAAGVGIRGVSEVTLVKNRCLGNRLVAVGVPGAARVTMTGNVLERKGGMPPIVAIMKEAKVVMVGNTIEGGGIAGVMLLGELKAVGNRFQGADGGSGIWARTGSQLVQEGNVISGYKKSVRRDSGGK